MTNPNDSKWQKAKTLCLIVDEMAKQLEEFPSIHLDILGIAFYKDTGIWPLLKSAPIEMYHELTDTERLEAYNRWHKSLLYNPQSND